MVPPSQTLISDLIDQLGQLRGQEAARDAAFQQLSADRDRWKARAETAELRYNELRKDVQELLSSLDPTPQ